MLEPKMRARMMAAARRPALEAGRGRAQLPDSHRHRVCSGAPAKAHKPDAPAISLPARDAAGPWRMWMQPIMTASGSRYPAGWSDVAGG